ncbi:TPA: acyltransferase [Streptococcus pneumoniae]|uniref:Putative acetyl transferase n=1 Tax=Streptococcus pneumoniae TaxID=1313 RepID=Q4JYS9_STREE|nr:putative acetyl transferase [Streptococcus pneumoniae]HEU4055126.1 acyltransferase [Streptococcus pneumoniae]
MKKEEYNFLKVLTILLVVLGHSTYYIIKMNFGGIDYYHYINNNDSIIVINFFKKITEIIYYFHMPLFMAISGAFFRIQVEKNKWQSPLELFQNKFRRLLIPFIIFTILYTIPMKYISNYFIQTSIFNAIIGQLFLFGNTHLWYLYALFIIFMIAYFVLKKDTGFGMLLFLFALHLMSYKINITLIKSAFQFLFYFAIGFKFEQKREVYNHLLNHTKKFVYFLLIGFVVLIFMNLGIKRYSIIFSKLLEEILALYGSLVTYTIAYYLSRNTKWMNTRIYQFILVNGLGIYIFSDTLNYLILKWGFIVAEDLMITPHGIILMVIFRFLVTLILSLLITLAFKKLFPKYKWLVN